MSFLAAFRTPKAWTGYIIAKAPHTSTDSEGDSETRYCVTVKLDATDGVDRERSINVSPELYRTAQVGNEVIKAADNKHPVIQLGTSRAPSA